MFVSKYPVTKDGIEYLVEISKEHPFRAYDIAVKKKWKFGFNKTVYSSHVLEIDLQDIINDNDFLIQLTKAAIDCYTEENETKIKNEIKKTTQEKVFSEWDGNIEDKLEK